MLSATEALNTTPSQRELKKLFVYNPITGSLTYRIDVGTRGHCGEVPGCLNKKGYRLITVKGKRYRAHRLIWKYVYGREPQGLLDHADGNPVNNQLVNLREASLSQNAMNRKAFPNKTGYRGVYERPAYADGTPKYIGRVIAGNTTVSKYFTDPIEAAVWAARKRKELHGEFAR